MQGTRHIAWAVIVTVLLSTAGAFVLGVAGHPWVALGLLTMGAVLVVQWSTIHVQKDSNWPTKVMFDPDEVAEGSDAGLEFEFDPARVPRPHWGRD